MRASPVDANAAAQASDTKLLEPYFYALPFSSQMIVWAVRKRLDVLRGRVVDQDDILKVFHLADWGVLYEPLLDSIDIFMRYRRDQDIDLHAEHCPCLARHEAYLVNSLAHLQCENREEALLCLCELLTPTGARLALIQLRVIADSFRAQNLRSALLDLSLLRDSMPSRQHVPLQKYRH